MVANLATAGALKTALLTLLAMLAFAANSLLCRMALAPGLIDAASFSSVRVLAGAIILALIAWPRRRTLVQVGPGPGRARVWKPWPALMLFLYMSFFSFAYRSLDAGTGALILFAAVQLTMFIVALKNGEHFPLLSWLGLGLAVGGLIYLVLPGLRAPDPAGAVLMAIAGIAWGFYSLLGRSAGDAVLATANNFLLALPMVLLTNLFFLAQFEVTRTGLLLAITSGALASGLGYVIWYAALRGLSASRAATVQLSVPMIAALGGVVLLAEPLTERLVLATAATLSGVAIVLMQRARVVHN
jgi:drug/metabolite transporter (DMT)-like permease